MVVAPAGGTVRRADLTEGTAVEAGTELGTIASRQADQQVLASYTGVLVEWLVEDGDPVSPGDPMARLEPGVS
jgi:[acyl-carrier-protein] S-malonyltransferase